MVSEGQVFLKNWRQYRREEEINRVELDSLRKRKQMADNAARDAFLASMEGVDKSGQAYMMMELEREKLDALRTAAGDAPKEEVEAASVGFNIGIGGAENFVRGEETFPGLHGLPDSILKYLNKPDEVITPVSKYSNWADNIAKSLGE